MLLPLALTLTLTAPLAAAAQNGHGAVEHEVLGLQVLAAKVRVVGGRGAVRLGGSLVAHVKDAAVARLEAATRQCAHPPRTHVRARRQQVQRTRRRDHLEARAAQTLLKHARRLHNPQNPLQVAHLHRLLLHHCPCFLLWLLLFLLTLRLPQ